MNKGWAEVARKKGLLGKDVGVNAEALPVATVATLPEALWCELDESQFQDHVVALARSWHWRVAHCRKVKVKAGRREWWETTMPAGWPDLTLVRRGVLAFVELKVGDNVQSAEQKEWASELIAVPGVHYFLWRPQHLKFIARFLETAKE